MAQFGGMQRSPLLEERQRKRGRFGWLRKHKPFENVRDPAVELISKNAGNWQTHTDQRGSTRRWQDHPGFRGNYFSPEVHNTGIGSSLQAKALYESLVMGHGGEHEEGNGHKPHIDPQTVQKIYNTKRLEEHMRSLVEKINKDILVPLNKGIESHIGVHPGFTWASEGPMRTGLGRLISGSKLISKRMRDPANVTNLKLLQQIPGASFFGAARGDAILSSLFNAVVRPLRRERVGDVLQREGRPLIQEFERAKNEYESAVSRISPAEIRLFDEAMEAFSREQQIRARKPPH